MKAKSISAFVLALLLALPVTCIPAAATFSDVTGNWVWAEPYIEDMAERGIYNGYEDGTFRPANELTAAEALAVCARCLGLDDDLTGEIAADRADEVSAIFGTSMSWFQEDFAVCMELGIVTQAELKSLWQSGKLSESIEKEDFALYLVRAMGLEKLAESLPSYSMSFADLSSISADRQPYVYLLNAYGIVEGTEDNKFEPQSAVNRAVSATMLSRVVEFMEDKGLSVELPEYTDYDWTAGIIASATAGDNNNVLLTLSGEGGTNVISLSSDVTIYLNNMTVSTGSLKEGMYARVCLDEDGEPASVRLVPSDRLETVSGTVSSASDDALTMLVNGVTKSLSIDRFTQVTVGGTTGDRTLIDTAAAYTNAVCTLDENDVLMLQLSGGTSEKTGLISSVTAGTSETALQVTAFDGVTQAYIVPSTAAITVNGLTGSLKTGYVGRYISMRISNDISGQVVSAAVDTDTEYIQASVLGVTYTSTPNSIYVLDLSTRKSVAFNMADDPTITYEGSEVAFNKISKGWYITARLDSDGCIEMIEGYEGTVTIEGTLTAISYGSTTEIYVTADDDSVYAFSLDMTDLPEIQRSDSTSSIDKLRVGDTVTVTLAYNAVTLIESEPQAASVTGTITRIVQDTSGNTIELELEDGSTASYTITNATVITNDGDAVEMSSLQLGDTLALVLNSGQVISVTVVESSDETSSTVEITGKVLYVNTTDKTILLRLTDDSGTEYIVTVNAPSGTAVLSISGGSLSLSKLAIDDELIVYGAYESGEFNADLILRK